MYKATAGGNGTTALTEALIKYPVELSNYTSRLRPVSLGTNGTIHRILCRTETTEQRGTTKSTCCDTVSGSFALKIAPRRSVAYGDPRAMNYQYSAPANLTFVGGWTKIKTEDTASNTYLKGSSERHPSTPWISCKCRRSAGERRYPAAKLSTKARVQQHLDRLCWRARLKRSCRA